MHVVWLPVPMHRSMKTCGWKGLLQMGVITNTAKHARQPKQGHESNRGASSLDTELPELVPKAIVALPGQALPILLPVGAVQGNAPFPALAIAHVTIAIAIAGATAARLRGLPEGEGPDACHLPDQPIQRLHLKCMGRVASLNMMKSWVSITSLITPSNAFT